MDENDFFAEFNELYMLCGDKVLAFFAFWESFRRLPILGVRLNMEEMECVLLRINPTDGDMLEAVIMWIDNRVGNKDRFSTWGAIFSHLCRKTKDDILKAICTRYYFASGQDDVRRRMFYHSLQKELDAKTLTLVCDYLGTIVNGFSSEEMCFFINTAGCRERHLEQQLLHFNPSSWEESLEVVKALDDRGLAGEATSLLNKTLFELEKGDSPLFNKDGEISLSQFEITFLLLEKYGRLVHNLCPDKYEDLVHFLLKDAEPGPDLARLFSCTEVSSQASIIEKVVKLRQEAREIALGKT